jgi:serine/threonine protein kinase
MKPETVYFSHDGNHKVSRLGLGYYFTSDLLNKNDLYSFINELHYWTKPSYIPPELSADSSYPVVTVSMDIWSLGVILGELMNMGTSVSPPITYSKKLHDLQSMMLNPIPQKRPTAQYVVNYMLQMVKTGPEEMRVKSTK